MKRLLVATLVIGVLVAPVLVSAASLPSAKATFAFNPLVALHSAPCSGATCNVDTGWQTILRQQIKMANQKDLFLGASLQCGIVTDTTVKSLNGSTDSAEARGTIRVRIKLTAPDDTVSYAEPSYGVDATNTPDANTPTNPAGIVFCDRIQTLIAKFSGLNCTADMNPLSPTYGQVSCADPETLELILKTLNANAFNFVAPNRVPGVHQIEVQAKTSAKVSTTGTNGSLGNANAFIGAGSVAVEAVRMIKGNDGTTLDLQ